MSSSPKPPKPVDPNDAAAAQARWTRTGITNPFGSARWEGDNQVITPSDELMAMFSQASGIASGGGERYQAPGNFGSIRDQVMSRLNDNAYGVNPPPANRSKPIGKPANADLGKGTPWRDAFLGAANPETGERGTLRHVLTGGIQGAIPRGIMGMINERRQPIDGVSMPVRSLDEMNARRDSRPPAPQGQMPQASALPPQAQAAIAALFGGQQQANLGLMGENMARTQDAVRRANAANGGPNYDTGAVMVNTMNRLGGAGRSAVDDWTRRNIQ